MIVIIICLRGADPEIFRRGGGLRSKSLKEKCLLIQVSTCVKQYRDEEVRSTRIDVY